MSTALNIAQAFIGVWVIEDEHKYREGLVYVLDNVSDLRCTQAFPNCEKMQAVIADSSSWEPPDVVLMDIKLHEPHGRECMTGIEGIAVLKTRLPEVPIVMLTNSDATEIILEALQAGASGYLLKSASIDEIIDAVRAAHRGGILMPEPVAHKVLSFFRKPLPDKDYNLTAREHEVLQRMATGLAKKQIADELSLSPHTVDNHIRHIYQKLHVHSGTQAVSKAIRERLI